jgi:hypothetical protein
MNINKSFTFPFEDKAWLSKLGIGALVSLVPILNFAWSGYMVELIRNVTNNTAEPLPNWDNFGKKFTEGLILVLVGLVYALPIIILICLPLSVMTVPAILAGDGGLGDFGQVVAGVGGVLFFCMMLLLVAYSLILSVVFPAILVVFAREGTFASCFKFREVFDIIGRNAGPFFTAWGVSLGAGIAIGFVTGIVQTILGLIPCIGWIAALVISMGLIVYTSSVYAHLFGQFGNIAFGQNQQVIES